MIEARLAHAPANATDGPAARTWTYRHAAVWSLRTFLAVVIFAWFSVAVPRAPQIALTLELGRRAVFEHRFEFGWLGAVFFYLAQALAGFGGLAAFGGVSVVIALALVEFRARPRTGDVLSLAAMILAAFCFLDALRVGGGAAHWIFAAAFLLLLERARGWALFGTIAVAVVWANAAPDAILAPVLAAAVAIGRILDRNSGRGEIAHVCAVTLGCAAALLVTPAGTKYLTLAPLAAHLDRGLAAVIPLAPNVLAPRAYVAFFIVLLFGAALGVRRCRWEDRLLFGVAIFLGFWNGENLPLAGIIAAPILVGTLVRVAPQFFAAPSSRERLADAVVAAIALCLAFGFAVGAQGRAMHYVLEQPPQTIVNRALADGRPHRLFCVVVEWCDYAIGFKDTGVVMDGRIERYDDRERTAQHAIAHLAHGWKGELSSRRVDLVLAHRSDALSTILAFVPGWSVVDLMDGVVLLKHEGTL